MPRRDPANSAVTVPTAMRARVVGRKAIDAGRDRGKRNRSQAMRHGQVQRRAIAGRQQFLLALAAAVPDRTDRVNDVFAGSR